MARRRSLTDRWNRLRSELTLRDLLLDVSGKILVALGLGALWAQQLRPNVALLILIGLALSITVKAKYWKQFWV